MSRKSKITTIIFFKNSPHKNPFSYVKFDSACHLSLFDYTSTIGMSNPYAEALPHAKKPLWAIPERFLTFSILFSRLQLQLLYPGNKCLGNLQHVVVVCPHPFWMPLYAYM